MKDKVKTIINEINSEITVKNSKFLVFLRKITSENDFNMIIDTYKNKYKDATHICYAYRIYNPNIEKAFDDGEPSGTAGNPILKIFKSKEIYNVSIIVVRYFGGIKLGTGGLVKAYLNAAKKVIDDNNVKELKKVKHIKAYVKLGFEEKFENFLKQKMANIIKKVYENEVFYEFIINYADDLLEVNYVKIIEELIKWL